MSLSGPAAARLYDEHVDAIYGYVARRLGPELAIDVVGDVFEQALRTHDRRVAKVSDRGWLLAIATALLRRHGTTECVRLESWPTDSTGSVSDPLLTQTSATAGQLVGAAMAAAAALEPVDRDLLFLTAWEHCSAAEAGEATGLTASAVRAKLTGIRKELKRLTTPGRPAHDGPDS